MEGLNKSIDFQDSFNSRQFDIEPNILSQTSTSSSSLNISPRSKYKIQKHQSSVKFPSSVVYGYNDMPRGHNIHAPALINGVLVPELNEEINDAYDDLIKGRVLNLILGKSY